MIYLDIKGGLVMPYYITKEIINKAVLNIFNDVNYYKEFRDKSYFYQYFSDGDTYKFDDNTYTYKLFSSINTKEDFFLPTDKDELIKHYQDDNYTCKVVDN